MEGIDLGQPQAAKEVERPIPIRLGGLDVEFPYKPYGIQRAMMGRIIVAYTNKQNCLIESPTGTGKSLSLICSTLAWQQRSKADQRPFVSANFNQRQMETRMARLQDRSCSCGARPHKTVLDELKEAKGKRGSGKDVNADDDDESCLKKMKISDDNPDMRSPYFKQEKGADKKGDPNYIVIECDDDAKEAATQIYKHTEDLKANGTKNEVDDDVEIIFDNDADTRKPLSNSEPNKQKQEEANNAPKGDGGLCKNCLAIKTEEEYISEMGPSAANRATMKKVRIYYGTRTHKQIAQIVRELKKTNYTRDLRMNILSSRDRTCIHEEVRDRADRNDKCQELVKNKSKAMSSRKSSNVETCTFYRDSNQMLVDFENIYKEESTTFDIEDAVEFGQKFHLCPYYGMRALQEDADITFCPYNYILDPNIRSAMNINLRNSIIILDEAHNIEDICRDSASFVINTQQIDEILASITRAAFNYLQGSTVRDAYDFFRNQFTDLKAFLLRFDFPIESQVKDNDCIARRVLAHQEMMNSLALINLGSKNIQTIKENLKALRGDEDDNNEKSKSQDDSPDGSLNNNELQNITQLANTLEFIYAHNNKHAADYRCIVSKHLDRPKPGMRQNNKSITDGDVHLFQFSLMCMNPGIAFQKIHEHCWSVVVASGTLSPIDSLKTELGCVFDQIFEGSHVIAEDRIFASILAYGPNNVELNCSYNNSLRLDFQDELGQVVRDVCKIVPSGILIFFPSYDRMENLYQRWFTKGYIKDIQAANKKIYREQKNYTAGKFDEELKKYHRAATGNLKGAVMMAVYRGKISEGIDFSDAAARAVISIGIPFPNVKEITIALKREYNNQARRTRPELMDGATWYQTQAMRALNQSLGRVIRHKDDWGAIIMLDSRLRGGPNMNGISKWVRRCTQVPPNYGIFHSCLKEFVDRREGRLAAQED